MVCPQRVRRVVLRFGSSIQNIRYRTLPILAMGCPLAFVYVSEIVSALYGWSTIGRRLIGATCRRLKPARRTLAYES